MSNLQENFEKKINKYNFRKQTRILDDETPKKIELHLIYELRTLKDKINHLEIQIDKIATYLNQN